MISYSVEGVSVRGTTIRETVARIRSLGAAMSVLGMAISDSVEAASVRGATIRETVARIRSLGTLTSHRRPHVTRPRSARKRSSEILCAAHP